MKRTFIIATILLVFAFAVPTSQAAVGTAFGALSTAQPIGQGAGDFGFGLGLGDATTFMGTFTYGMSKYTNGRLKLGLFDPDGGDAKFVFGADFAWQLFSANAEHNRPVDLAFGGLFEYCDFGGASIMQIGGFSTAAYPMTMKNGQQLIPYARFNLRIERLTFDFPAGVTVDDSESNLEIGLNGGVKWQATSSMSFYGEFQLDGNDGLFLGMDLNVM